MKQDIEKCYSRRALVAKLRRLVDALERDKVFVTQVSGRRVVVPRAAVYGIEHEREGGVEEIEFRIRWKTARRKKARAIRPEHVDASVIADGRAQWLMVRVPLEQRRAALKAAA